MMHHAPRHTATYRVLQDSGGMRFRFFCEVSGAAICTTAPAQPQPINAALDKAWLSEGREHFSLCHRCGRWVSDLMYNPNTLQCVDCSPLGGAADLLPPLRRKVSGRAALLPEVRQKAATRRGGV